LEARVPARLSTAEGRKFGLTVGGAFLLLAGIMYLRHHETRALVSGALGAMLVVAGVAIPKALHPVHAAWMRFALVLSKVTTPIFMALVYFLAITPVALIRRLSGHNSIQRQRDAKTFWVERSSARRSNLLRQF
jgi:hypothetical protein